MKTPHIRSKLQIPFHLRLLSNSINAICLLRYKPTEKLQVAFFLPPATSLPVADAYIVFVCFIKFQAQTFCLRCLMQCTASLGTLYHFNKRNAHIHFPSLFKTVLNYSRINLLHIHGIAAIRIFMSSIS